MARAEFIQKRLIPRGRIRITALVTSLAGLTLLSACDKRNGGKNRSTPWFEEVSELSGVRFRHVSGHRERYWFPEIMAGGVCMFDYDDDGDLDLYFIQSGDVSDPRSVHESNLLFRNRGDGTFEDVTDHAGVGDKGYGMGCACGDYDGDGDTDVYVTNVGPNVLFRNNGNGTFTDVTSDAGVGDPAWSSSAAFVDYDDDGLLDLFVVNYVVWTKARELECLTPDRRASYCSPLSYDKPARDTLYRNLGRGRFSDATVDSGIGQTYGNGLGIVCADFNGDHFIDVYVANDGTENQLWINQRGGRFTDRALYAGCAVNENGRPEAGMGVATVDIDQDGDLDLFLSHLRGETNTVYLNRNGLFVDATAASGLGMPSLIFTGFGLGFADFDHDTHVDLYVVNGRVTWRLPQNDPRDPFAEPNLLFQPRGDGRFEEVLPRGGTANLIVATSRAAAFGDIDNDGDIDIVIVNKDAPATVLRNIVGARANWIMLRVLDRRGHDAIGALVCVEVQGRKQWRAVQTAYSYCAANDPRVHFGLGRAEQVDRVVVHWLDGFEESFGPIPAGSVHLLRRGFGK